MLRPAQSPSLRCRRSRRTQPSAIAWDREADVVVIGGGAGGLVAAIAAREKGASVIIVEKNFDIGGRAMMSFGGLYIGGGNRLQKGRDLGKDDTPDKVFEDWSRPEKPMGRFSDRELVRTYADNNLDLFEWLEKHGIKWDGYRPNPDRLDRSRTRLNVVHWPNEVTGPARGPGFVRPLAKTAREMGVEILLQQQMTKIHRESPTSGRVTGISVVDVDNNYRQGSRTMNIRARKGVVVATGGSAGNPVFRTMFDPRLTEEYQAENSEWTRAHRRRRDRRDADRRGAWRDRVPDDAGRQSAQQGPHGQEEQRWRDGTLSDRAALLPRARHRPRGRGLPERHSGEGKRPALLHRDRAYAGL